MDPQIRCVVVVAKGQVVDLEIRRVRCAPAGIASLLLACRHALVSSLRMSFTGLLSRNRQASTERARRLTRASIADGRWRSRATAFGTPKWTSMFSISSRPGLHRRLLVLAAEDRIAVGANLIEQLLTTRRRRCARA